MTPNTAFERQQIVGPQQEPMPRSVPILTLGAAIAIGAVMALAMWVLTRADSWLDHFLGDHEAIGLLWVFLNYPAFLIGMLVTDNFHAPADWAVCLGAFVEWFVVGYVCAWIVVVISRRRGKLKGGDA